MIARSARTLVSLLVLSLLSTSPVVAAAPLRCAGTHVAAGGASLWADLQGEGPLTVVFEAGNGNDSTVWSAVAPRVRALGIRTLVYDRAGLGRSGPLPAGYSIESEVGRLRSLLDICDVEGPILFVGASYGGAIGLLTAAADARIAGMVLVDAVVPEVATEKWAIEFRDAARPDYAAVRKEAPALAAAVIPLVEAMPQTATLLRQAQIADIPIIDIVADKTAVPGKDAEADKAWVSAHADFAAKGRNRSAVLATGSGHRIMIDKPEVVITAIAELAGSLETRPRLR